MQTININTISLNPDNPRTISKTALARLVESVKKFPHFLEKRGLVIADGIILGGNQRYLAIQEALKDEAFRKRIGVTEPDEIPSSWIQDATGWDTESKRAFIIADNATLGEWDFNLLTTQWDVKLLEDFCIELPEVFDVDEVDAPTLNDGDMEPFQQMTFTLHDEQVEEIKAAIEKAKAAGYGQSAVNENSNGNALAWVAQVYNRG